MKIMKRNFICFLVVLISTMFVGCGKAETSEGGLQECRNLKAETTYLPRFKEDNNTRESSMLCLGTQFLGEEPVQLWAGYGSGNIYLWSMDRKKERVAKGVPGEFTKGGYIWYLDQEGCLYLIEMADSNRVIKLDSEGKELFRFEPEAFASWRVKEIRQAPDKKVYCVIGESGREDRLAEMDPETGDITILEQVDIRTEGVFLQTIDLGTGANGPAVYRESVDIREVDTERGDMTEILSLRGLSYSTIRTGGDKVYSLADFRISEDGCAQMLLAAYDGTAYMEQLSVEVLQRIPIVIYSPGTWMKDQIDRFNRENDTYYIVQDEGVGLITVGGAMYEEGMKAAEDHATRLSIELATGKGPDILVGESILGGNVMDMIEKGVLEDLRPYMERSGIREEDYFPMVFDAWRQGDGIYGICPELTLLAVEADKEIVGESPDIRGTTEALLAFQGDMVYMEGRDSRAVLRLLLEGSETLGGMVDWETGTFDFDREFFYDLLEVARRYGDTPTNNEPRIALRAQYDDFYNTTSPSELEELGVTLAGWMFDDGCHAMVSSRPIAINANSPNKEAAWEFLCLLLGEEAQKEQRLSGYPVKRDMFDAWAEKRMDRHFGAYNNRENRITGEYDHQLWIYDLSGEDGDFIRNEKLPYFKKMLEEARHLPLRPAPILNIICEEAEDYFNGNKSAEEVADIVENRVELYLNERR